MLELSYIFWINLLVFSFISNDSKFSPSGIFTFEIHYIFKESYGKVLILFSDPWI